jgi:uncharacterized protein (DUF1697 family)
MKYAALLRGINVGGNNLIKMSELKTCFENIGFTDVVTYIQSGNVLFRSSEKNRKKLTNKIENALSKQFNYKSCVVVVSHNELKKIVALAPKGFGITPSKYRYDVIFLKQPLTALLAIKNISTKEGVDTADTGKNVLYFSRLIERAAQSHLAKIVKLPIYKHLTIRNWNTTTKLLALMES